MTWKNFRYFWFKVETQLCLHNCWRIKICFMKAYLLNLFHVNNMQLRYQKRLNESIIPNILWSDQTFVNSTPFSTCKHSTILWPKTPLSTSPVIYTVMEWSTTKYHHWIHSFPLRGQKSACDISNGTCWWVPK